MRRSGLLLIPLLVCSSEILAAEGAIVRGQVIDPAGLPLPGAVVTLSSAATAQARSTTTDGDGRYSFDAVSPGTYDVAATLDAFAPERRGGIAVGSETITIDLQLALATVRQDVTVTAQAGLDLLGTTEPDAPASVSREVIDVAMLPNSQYDDVLSLMPNVVRGPDGQIAVGGARPQTSGLFINGLPASDPAAGGSGVLLPLEAVNAVQVYAGGAPAEFGRATGGITDVQTRTGTDRFRMSVDSFFPRLLYGDGGVQGVAFWDPNLGVSGPLAPGRAWYQQAISYRFDRNTFTTLAGADQNVFRALLSWTQVDWRLNDSQHLRVAVSVDPRDTDRANITAFTPSGSAPHVEQGGWTASVSNAITAGTAVVDVRASMQRTQATVTPNGNRPFIVGHQLTAGTYFDAQDRRGQRIDAGAVVTWSPRVGHLLKVGVSVDAVSMDQSVRDADIRLLRSDGTLARLVTFGDSPLVAVAATQLAMFVQDRWTPRPWLTLDAGLRYDGTSTIDDPAPAPRIGWTAGTANRRTSVSGSAGLFSDTMPLNGLAFGALPTRRVVAFDADGLVTGDTIYRNVLATDVAAPQALRWDLQMDRRVGRWLVRTRYEERHGQHELVVNVPGATRESGNTALAMLASSGRSTSRAFETTAGFHAAGGGELYVSYVRGTTRGNANSLDATEGLMRVPFVQPDQRASLPVDVPRRMLAWAVIHLPSRLTVAPFLELRGGFPYTAIDDAWQVVGAANAWRLPWMGTLDLSVNRIVRLPMHLPDARVGLKLYNIASAHTEREVQRDIDRPDFGARYDPVPRDFSFVFEFLWGQRHPRT